jgi:hypothetical protein
MIQEPPKQRVTVLAFFSTGSATATTATVSGLSLKDNLETNFKVSRLLNNP